MDADTIFQSGGLFLGGSLATKLLDWARDWWRSRQPQKIEQPLNVNKLDKYVTLSEFARHVEQNAAEHKAMVDDRERNYEALYNGQRANDKLTSEIKGKLDGIKDDLSLIKDKLFKSK